MTGLHLCHLTDRHLVDLVLKVSCRPIDCRPNDKVAAPFWHRIKRFVDQLTFDQMTGSQVCHLTERHLTKIHLANRHLANRHLADRHLADRHFADRHFANRHLADRHLVNTVLKATCRQFDCWPNDRVTAMSPQHGVGQMSVGQTVFDQKLLCGWLKALLDGGGESL